MRRALVAVLALGVAVLACKRGEPGPTFTPKPQPQPLGATCQDACNRWASLACKEGLDARCVPSCENVLRVGFIRWNMPCRAQVTSCEAIDRCEDR